MTVLLHEISLKDQWAELAKSEYTFEFIALKDYSKIDESQIFSDDQIQIIINKLDLLENRIIEELKLSKESQEALHIEIESVKNATGKLTIRHFVPYLIGKLVEILYKIGTDQQSKDIIANFISEIFMKVDLFLTIR